MEPWLSELLNFMWTARAVRDHVAKERKVTRIYLVERTDSVPPGTSLQGVTIESRLVRAGNPAQAIRHVVRSLYRAAVPGQDELVAAIREGLQVEDASPDEPTGN